MTKNRRLFFILLLVIVGIAVIFALLFYHGFLQINAFGVAPYDVRGVDVSAYQGEIDWAVLTAQGIDFAFVKATEGSTFVDKTFGYNFEQARNAGLVVGAYHFFSIDSSPYTQAENIISTVRLQTGDLPIVIDFEIAAGFADTPAADTIRADLSTLLELLTEEYQKKPILYATEEAYDAFLQEGYGEYLLWIRSVYRKPQLPENRNWTFWQYSSRGRMDGFSGDEKFIDLNVFVGNRGELMALCV